MRRLAFLIAAPLALLAGGCVVDGATDPAPAVEQSPAAETEVPVQESDPDAESEVIDRSGYSEADKVSCIAKGGTYERRGMMGMYSCATPYADAGKTCRKAGDCEGQCRIERMDSGAEVGKCQATTDNFGCYAYLGDEGEVLGICVD